jgi:hypothetical protein
MTAHKYPDPIPLHVTPPPDSDARREAHITEAVAQIPPPPRDATDRALLEHVAREIYATRIELVHMRVGNQRAEDHNQQAHVILASRMDRLDDTVAGMGRHVEQRDSVSNEAALETAAKVESARRVASEAQTTAVDAKAVADRAWSAVGKTGALALVGGAVAKIVKDVFFGGPLP